MKTRMNLALGGTVIATLSLLGSTVYGQCDTTPPSGAIIQNDPDVCDGADPAADPNGGCFAPATQTQDLGPLAEGTHVIAGTMGYDSANGGDYDWFTWTLAQQGFITITVASEVPTTGLSSVAPGWFLGTGNDCTDYDFPPGYAGDVGCDFVTSGPDLYVTSGGYHFVCFPYFAGDMEVVCPERISYTITI